MASNQPSPPTRLAEVAEQAFRGWGMGDAASWLSELTMLAALAAVALTVHVVARKAVRPALLALVKKTRTRWDDVLAEHKVLLHLIHLAPALVLFLGAAAVYPAGGPLRSFPGTRRHTRARAGRGGRR